MLILHPPSSRPSEQLSLHTWLRPTNLNALFFGATRANQNLQQRNHLITELSDLVPPPNSFLWCVYSCVALYKHAAKGNVKAR